MKLVVLDGFTLNPGDLSWDKFKQYGDLSVYDFTSLEDRVSRIGEAKHIFINKVKIDEALLKACPQIEYIGELATGFDNIDLDVCKRYGVTVTTVPGYGSQAVAQYAFGLLLELCQNNRCRIQDVRKGLWAESVSHWQKWTSEIISLEGKTLGIMGLGGIGKEMAKMAKGFGMKVIYYQRHENPELSELARYVDLKTLYSLSDVISLHMPLNEENYHILNEEAFLQMKENVMIINTARGALIDEKALLQALKNKKVYGVALDVLENEPISKTNPLLSYDNCLLTPHLAWGAKSAREKLLMTALENYESYLNGQTKNRLV